MSRRVRRRVRITGRVQGVFFRDETRARAESSGIAGWIRNNPDGTVEAVLEGPEGELERLVAWCRRGPSGADVEGIRVEREEVQGERGFAVS